MEIPFELQGTAHCCGYKDAERVLRLVCPSSHYCFPAFPAFDFRVSRLQISAIPHLTIQDQHLAIRSSSLSDTFVV
jgi:hypothetical protein